MTGKQPTHDSIPRAPCGWRCQLIPENLILVTRVRLDLRAIYFHLKLLLASFETNVKGWIEALFPEAQSERTAQRRLPIRPERCLVSQGGDHVPLGSVESKR